jgi:hypothetical protein
MKAAHCLYKPNFCRTTTVCASALGHSAKLLSSARPSTTHSSTPATTAIRATTTATLCSSAPHISSTPGWQCWQQRRWGQPNGAARAKASILPWASSRSIPSGKAERTGTPIQHQQTIDHARRRPSTRPLHRRKLNRGRRRHVQRWELPHQPPRQQHHRDHSVGRRCSAGSQARHHDRNVPNHDSQGRSQIQHEEIRYWRRDVCFNLHRTWRATPGSLLIRRHHKYPIDR